MEKGLTNITSATDTILIDFDSQKGNINNIQISNNSSSNAVTISLFLSDGTTANNAYFVKNLILPVGVALFLNENVAFDDSVLKLVLTTAGTSPDVSVIIK